VRAHRLFGRDFRSEQGRRTVDGVSRAAREPAGGFREHVYAGEDLVFSAAALELGFRAALAEDATAAGGPGQRGRPTRACSRSRQEGISERRAASVMGAGIGVIDAIRGVPQPRPHR
jgi:hypothetical protein